MEPGVLAGLVEQHEPEVPVTSGPNLPAAVEAGTAVASAGTAGEAGTEAAGTAEAAGVEDECCCRKQRGQSSISKCLRSVLSTLSTRWLKSSKRRLSSAYWK